MTFSTGYAQRTITPPLERPVYLACTHTHRGPDTIGLWGPDMTTSGVDPETVVSLKGKVVGVALTALGQLQPAWVRSASVRVPGVVKNARDPQVVDDELTCVRFCQPESGPGDFGRPMRSN
ncbi:MAG: hypothetical protein V3S14_11065 [Anaerolineae bacterium]